MTILARAAAFAAAITLVAAARLEAQSSTIRVTIAGGPHAGTYEKADLCAVNGDKFPSMFMMAYTVGTVGPKTPRSIEFFSAAGKGKPDGFVVNVLFRGGAGERIAYEIYAIPPELQPPPRAEKLRGRGSVTVRPTATGRAATFRGQTADGVRMEGSVDCRNDSGTGS